MSGDCSKTKFVNSHVSPLNPYSSLSYPIPLMVCLTTGSKSGLPVEVISPAIKTILFLIIVSHATLLFGSSAKYASKTASEI